ncbi:MAG: prepilin-type N-terminal cleavage/methylation domain-containing protein, partial [Gammaproteobacteria bacterium]|nr:prepilin-type N-terminal cleavage/methylation domain-containing protein [Gammaproteobacteria bacterium]
MRRQGSTLTELVAVLAIVGIMMSTAMPSMLSLYERSRAVATINALMGAVQFTRHSAVTFGSPATLCPSSD